MELKEVSEFLVGCYLDGFEYKGQFPIFIFRKETGTLRIEICSDCPVATDDQLFNQLVEKLKTYDSDAYVTANYIKFNNQRVANLKIIESSLQLQFRSRSILIFYLAKGFTEPLSIFICNEKTNVSQSVALDQLGNISK